MSKYNAFRRTNDINNNCVANYESSFIMEGTSAVTIRNLRLNKSQNAAIIITDKEGPDTSLVYTFKERAKENELLKGDYYTWKEHIFLVVDDILVVNETNYKKQRSVQCNVSFDVGCDCGCSIYHGHFVSSLSSYLGTALEKNLNITSYEKPMLIVADANWVTIGKKLIISGKPYKIAETDTITNAGIAYCSLDRDFIDKQPNVAPNEPGDNVLIAGIKQKVQTNFAHFVADKKIDIVSKTLNEVEFVVPYGYEELTIITKTSGNEELVTTYKVVV